MSVVFETMRKSPAVSVWILPELAGRERVAILPSGLPVEKEKEAPEAPGTSRSKPSAPPAAVLLADKAANTVSPSRRRVGVSFLVFVLLRSLIMFTVLFVSAFLIGGRAVGWRPRT